MFNNFSEGFGLRKLETDDIFTLYDKVQLKDNAVIKSVVKFDFPINGELRNNEQCFYKVKQLAFDEDYPRREAFENVLLSMNNEAFNFVYILTGTEEGIELCIGVVQNKNENQPVLGKKLSAANYGEIVANVFEGNFNGSTLEKMTGQELERLGESSVQHYKNAGVILGIPSINKKENGEEYDFQGIDRLVNSMLGLDWRLVIVCEPVSKEEIRRVRESAYALYNSLSRDSKKTIQTGISEGSSLSYGSNKSTTEGNTWGYTKNQRTQEGSVNINDPWGSSLSTSYSEGKNSSTQEGENKGFSANRGSSTSITSEIANKHASELMRYIDESLIERLNTGYCKGLYKTSIFYMAKEPSHANRLESGLMSIFTGNQSSYSPLYAQRIDLGEPKNRNILSTFQNQYLERSLELSEQLLLLGRPEYSYLIGLNTYLTSGEISLIAGLPQKEVPGLSLKETIGFGLNEKAIEKDSAISLGVMVQKGRDLEKIPFLLSKDSLAKHTFIAGVTGSGKTTTCHRLLSEANVPFLVIEPAKTEYRTLIRKDRDVTVFTLGNEMVAPFRINPFELIKGEVISAHVDMIKATFTSAFPMEASMPQLLEEAIYKIYQKKGWNIDTNENEIYGDQAFDPEVNSFPILSDLLHVMKEVVESKHFSAQMQGDYIGSLVSRLSNLTVGSKGNMLNCENSIDFRFIAHHSVILEMEELKSPEDKSLFMGFILARLSAVIKDEHRKNPNYQHITLIEEAHRLLAKVEYGDSGSKKTAVETFTDLLAEVRKYGEGLIVVDQIPNKLAPEVLKNTNTKIIHKILAKDDKEAVGDTMLMDDKQKEYLSALTVGNAIVFSEHTDKPVHVHIKQVSNTNEEQIDNEEVRVRFLEKKEHLGGYYQYLELGGLMPLFSEIVSMLRKLSIDQEKYQKFKVRFQAIAKQYAIEEEKLWEKLISRYERISGKAIADSENEEKRLSALLDFFSQVFFKTDFNDDDIYEHRQCCFYLS